MSTYTPIATVTVTNSTTNAIDFTGIPQNYTDLVIVGSFFTGNSSLGVRVGNGSFDTGSNYSNTVLRADSSGAATNRGVNGNLADVGNGYADEGATIILNFQNYSNTTTNKIFLGRWTGKWTAGGTYVNATANLWRSTSAINQIRLLNYAGSTVYFTNGSTFNLYGIASGGPKAFGGDTVTTDGTYYYHTFLSSGTFTPTQALSNVDYLVVAGGGSGGNNAAGGGGAGGLRCTVGATGGGGSLESKLSLSAQAYTVTVGAGAAINPTANGNGISGSNSVFATVTSNGGSGGMGALGVAVPQGGSGGGAYFNGGTPGTGTTGQGFAGGGGGYGVPSGSGGGGGAGAVGSDRSGVRNGGAGGTGVATSISGSSTTYAGGGGGGGGDGGGTGGAGGAGGGGRGSDGGGNNATNATANTGGGGGGGSYGGSNPGSFGNGGSGIVIIRYSV